MGGFYAFDIVLLLLFADYGDDKKKKEEKKDKEDSMKSLEEKKKYIKSFIEKIPTDKKVLFNYQIDWAAVDNVSKIRHYGSILK